MRRLIILLALAFAGFSVAAQVTNPGTAATQSATDHANSNIQSGVDNGVGKAEGAIKGLFGKKKKKNNAQTEKPADVNKPAGAADQPSPQGNSAISVYNNYDFVPGDKILFADDFADDADGEFPAHWELKNGQATANKVTGYESLVLTDGNYAKVKPRMKVASYLPAEFTIEFDTYFQHGAYGFITFFNQANSSADQDAYVTLGQADVQYESSNDNYSLNGNLAEAIKEDNYIDKWHHIAMAYKNKQLKVYVDQYRVLTIPDMHITPASIHFGGLASQDGPLVFRNVKIAAGGGMNMLGKKFTDAKIVTHGINFDIDKATLRPESMGTINQIKGILTDNPDLKFEIDGHTDNTGAAAHNLQLSQQRADAVKAQLVSMGISASRLTTKGYGDTKPVSDNTTPEGKAENRRVEFVKQ